MIQVQWWELIVAGVVSHGVYGVLKQLWLRTPPLRLVIALWGDRDRDPDSVRRKGG